MLFSIGGVGLAALLLIIGVVMSGNADFSKKYVTDQLVQQKITFKSADTLTDEERAAPCLVKYAGQELTTGKQAECYANEFIGLHVFTGETLRGMLLTSYGFSELGNKAAQAATVIYLGVLLLVALSIAGFVHALVTPRNKAFAPPEPGEITKPRETMTV